MMIPKKQALARTIINHLYDTIFTSDCIKIEARYYGKIYFLKWIVPI